MAAMKVETHCRGVYKHIFIYTYTCYVDRLLFLINNTHKTKDLERIRMDMTKTLYLMQTTSDLEAAFHRHKVFGTPPTA